jgi:hypothetical protein
MGRPFTSESFWERVDRSGDCWPWLGLVRPDGYARVWANRKQHYVHVMALRLLGVSIPDGHEVDHLCKVRHCVNPAHLEVVTPRENALRSSNPCAGYAKQTHCVHGHALDGDNLMLRDRGRGRVERVCLACRGTVCAICRERRHEATRRFRARQKAAA